MESLEDVWVHLNEKILRRCHLVVTIVDLVLDPVSEWLANYGGSHVADPLFGKAHDLLKVFGEVLEAILIPLEKTGDTWNRQSLVLRDKYGLNVVLFNT